MKSFKKDIFRTASRECLNCVENDVTIGTQKWTHCNATIAVYRDNTVIPYVDDATQWSNLTTGAWCHYDNDPANEPIYGKLYNWYAIAGVHDTASLTDPLLRKEFAPAGWHIPTKDEFTTLTNFVGGLSVTGTKLKEIDDCHWLGGSGATDDYGFTALPAGWRLSYGPFNLITTHCNWWSSTEFNGTFTWGLNLSNSSNYGSIAYMPRKSGLSVRFVKDVCLDCVAGDVTIGSQEWSRCNLDVTSYRNGDFIPQVTDPTAWANLTTGAWCWYANNSTNGVTYGKLYNWHAVNDPRGLAPFGYRIPAKTDWDTLAISLGGNGVAGGKLKETGFCHWESPNTNAVNTSNFQAYGAGMRNRFGTFSSLKVTGSFWSATPQVGFTDAAWIQEVYKLDGTFYGNYYYNETGISVRVIKEAPVAPACPDCVATDININGLDWNLCNTNITTYRDGTDIPQITNNADWFNATTGAWCWYNNDPANESTYGKLYNFYAIQGIHDAASLADPLLRKTFAPTGYHVPTEAEFSALNTFLGGAAVSGGSIKEVGTCHWQYNNGATNSSLFTGLPGGARVYNGLFDGIKVSAYWWTSSLNPVVSNPNMIAFTFQVTASQPYMYYSYKQKSIGASVRFIKD